MYCRSQEKKTLANSEISNIFNNVFGMKIFKSYFFLRLSWTYIDIRTMNPILLHILQEELEGRTLPSRRRLPVCHWLSLQSTGLPFGSWHQRPLPLNLHPRERCRVELLATKDRPFLCGKSAGFEYKSLPMPIVTPVDVPSQRHWLYDTSYYPSRLESNPPTRPPQLRSRHQWWFRPSSPCLLGKYTSIKGFPTSYLLHFHHDD